MTKIIYENNTFRVTRKNLTQRGFPHKQPEYIISLKSPYWHNMTNDELNEIRDVIDPNRNIAGRNGVHWKFKRKDQVDKLWVWLTLKWA